jgi:hypothetical protein
MKRANQNKMIGGVALILAMVSGNRAQAGGQIGNGGNAIVCYSDSTKKQMTSIELLDYWENSALGRPPIDLGDDTVSYVDKVKLAVARMQKIDAGRGDVAANEAALLYANIGRFIVDDLTNAPIQDDHPEKQPQGFCYQEQFAIQIKNPEPGAPRFLISGRLFNSALTSNDTRAGILLHESIYRVLIAQDQQTNSDAARRLNSFYASSAWDSLAGANLVQYYQNLGLQFTTGDFTLQTDTGLTLYLKGTAAGCKSTATMFAIAVPLHLLAANYDLHVAAGATVTISNPGCSQKFVHVNSYSNRFAPSEMKVILPSGNLEIQEADFDENNSLSGFSYPNFSIAPAGFSLNFFGKSLPCVQSFDVELKNNLITACFVGVPVPPETLTVTFPRGSIVFEDNIGGVEMKIDSQNLLHIDGGFNTDQTRLPIAGTDVYRAWTADHELILNSQGEVVRGATSLYGDDTDVLINATEGPMTAQFTDITVIAPGIVKPTISNSSTTYAFFKNTAGLKMIGDPVAFCKSVGASDLDDEISTSYTVVGTEKFFDLDTFSIVEKTDEPVNLLKPVDCTYDPRYSDPSKIPNFAVVAP